MVDLLLAGARREERSASLTLDAMRDVARFRSLAADWGRLWCSVPTATPFQSPAWLIPWWTVFAPGHLLTLAAWRGEQLVGIAPFYADDAGWARPVGISLSVYFDVLIDPRQFDQVFGALLCAMLGRIDLGVREWEMDALAPNAQALGFGSLGSIHPSDVCPVLEFAAGAEQLHKIVPVRKSRKLSMAHHRAQRAGGIEVKRVNRVEIPAAVASLKEMHGERWRNRGGGVLRDESVQQFHALALQALDRAGMLDFFVQTEGKDRRRLLWHARP